MNNYELIVEAMRARTLAYAPYSNHSVGAALVCADGTIYQGCNIENAAYTPTNCAERTAVFKAVSEGRKEFTKIAVVGGLSDKDALDFCAPCGVCRQVLMEFVDPKTFEVILAKVNNAKNVEEITESDVEIKVMTLEEILPLGFGPTSLA